MANPTTFEVSGDPNAAYQYALDNLTSQGFSITARPQHYETTMERGSKTGTLLIGAFVGKNQHLRVLVNGYAHGANLVISVIPDTTGAAAGVIGANRASKFYSEITANLANALHGAGILVSSNLKS